MNDEFDQILGDDNNAIVSNMKEMSGTVKPEEKDFPIY